MTRARRLLAAIAGLALAGTAVLSLAAPSPADLDPGERRTGVVDIAPPAVRADGAPGRPAEAEPPARHGNPLWAIPLETLTETRARPLFSASRRPPPPIVAAAPPAPPPAAPPPAPPRRHAARFF
ncbi:hypothetical protein PQJ75_16440 [Rhodoplanes sp. TEM]|uniref:hypothetical protein n=1 Tax=Rhodoplanes sp. TEM TaxID=3025489 RepID=UPI00234FD34B|nr:hypothetical protein [Rhodoplanes sp. TEM]MDC7985323.1 hypothetical protein [Rhodoplanes sp. TEM]